MDNPERIREQLRRLEAKRFSYDHTAKVFTVGDRKVSTAKAVEDPQLLRSTKEDAVPGTDPMLATDRRRFIMYPGMYDWLENNFDDEVRSEVIDVMQDVFAEAVGGESNQDRKNVGGFNGFEARRQSEKYPHILLQVMGNCVCMHVTDFGPFGERIWDSKFASFATHNLDTPAQKVSIQAGLGHLAWRTEQVSPQINW